MWGHSTFNVLAIPSKTQHIFYFAKPILITIFSRIILAAVKLSTIMHLECSFLSATHPFRDQAPLSAAFRLKTAAFSPSNALWITITLNVYLLNADPLCLLYRLKRVCTDGAARQRSPKLTAAVRCEEVPPTAKCTQHVSHKSHLKVPGINYCG